MSSSVACTCKGWDKRIAWYVMHYRCNYSAFNGYRYTPSDYSQVKCAGCGHIWRTKARYVDGLRKGPSVLT